MKYAHLEKGTNKLLGWYSDDIHDIIPTPNIEVSKEIWQEAININANCYENGEFIVKDFRTEEEIQKQAETKAIYDKKYVGIEYTNLSDEAYIVSLTNDDANGLIQVRTAFEMGISETNFYFENGTVVPLKSIDDLLHLGQFVSIERNKFFL